MFRSNEYCETIDMEYKGKESNFFLYALSDYQHIKNGLYGELTWKLIANDPATLEKLSGEFSCYCQFKH